jgi:uncharacterized protein with PQ loop repeat
MIPMSICGLLGTLASILANCVGLIGIPTLIKTRDVS